jgi:hypothetical protein
MLTTKQSLRILHREAELQRRCVRCWRLKDAAWLDRLAAAVIAVCDPRMYQAMKLQGVIKSGYGD